MYEKISIMLGTGKKVFVSLILGFMMMTADIVNAQTVVVSTIEGSATHIAEKVMIEAYNRLGRTLQVKYFPPERSLQMSNSGEVDGDLYRKMDINLTYPNLIVIPVPIVTIEEMVFTKGKKIQVSGWDSLLPYTVGYRKGIKVIENNLVKGTKIDPVSTLDQLFMKLENGRNDVVIETRLSGLETIVKLGLKDIEMLEPPIQKSQLFHCLHVKNKILVDPLTAVLQKMEKAGTIKELQNKAIEEYLKSISKMEETTE